jgi:Zn-dependent protease
MMRRGGFGPGQIILVLVLVLAGVMIYGRSANPTALWGAARELAILFPLLILSLALHEFAHAWVAYLLGDTTARNQGRLTLDPRAHLDPLGTLMLVLTLLIGIGIGWAKPVPVNPWRLRIGPRLGMAVVGIAGPVTNVLIAFVAILLRSQISSVGNPLDINNILATLAVLNVGLAVFNMIPLPPLDGYRVLLGILPGPMANSFAQIEPYGPMLLLLLVFMGQGLIGAIMRAVGSPLLQAMQILAA